MIRRVHVVFKTHLDIGFTDYADAVLDHWVHVFLPAAVELARTANADRSRPPRFIWTTGAFLIDLALRALPGPQAARLEEAVRLGDIAYHALPFTLHSELLSPGLFEAGLGIARRLNRRLGRAGIAAKMTDVPGHTRGIVGPLCRAGVRFLHIGVNEAAAMPDLPPLFRWENGAGDSLIVNWVRGYGGPTLPEGHGEALVLLHGADNAAPPSPARVEEALGDIRARFPGALVFASTLDAFARGLLPLADRLPVFRGEIGDTWIHGIGTDPEKLRRLRDLDRLREAWDTSGAWEEDSPRLPDGRSRREAFMENLLLVGEHTWGLDMKRFLTDFRHWNRPDFEAARERNLLCDRDGLGAGYDDCFAFARREFERMPPRDLPWNRRGYAAFEASHREQRDYLRRAVGCLGPALRPRAEALLSPPNCELPGDALPGVWEAVLGPFALRAGEAGVEISLDEAPLLWVGLPLYQEVGLKSYGRLAGHYLNDLSRHREWAVPDYLKPGLEHSDAPEEDRCHLPLTGRFFTAVGFFGLQGAYPEAPRRTAGCPGFFRLFFERVPEGLRLTLRLWAKPANRKPEALFLPMAFPGALDCALLKIGDWIDPKDSAPGSNRRTHGIRALSPKPSRAGLTVWPLDSPLLCLSAPRLLDFDGEAFEGRVYFNLYNNLWGTNFPLWYEEDIVSRFLIRTEADPAREAPEI